MTSRYMSVGDPDYIGLANRLRVGLGTLCTLSQTFAGECDHSEKIYEGCIISRKTLAKILEQNLYCGTELIFVKNITNYICGEKLSYG